jgi:NosR/NirI family nitrous oxide reductase transcriptional regulator
MSSQIAAGQRTRETSTPRKLYLARQRQIMLLTVLVVVGAWIYGYMNAGTDVVSLITEVLPGATSVESRGKIFLGTNNKNGEIVGYAGTGQAPGYGGPIEVLVGVNPDGDITGVKIVTERDSPGFFRLVENEGLPDQYLGRSISDPLELGNDLDAVSGATASAEGVANSVKNALWQIASEGLDTPLPPQKRDFKFGFPEVSLVLLYATGYLGHKVRNSQWKRRIRWGTLIAGLLVIGFIYTAPFTITMVISLLTGYWPDWHNNLYWYLLIGGILFVTTVDAKNPYCSWFCPFGAFQECVGALTGAKLYRPREWSAILLWIQRGLTLIAIVIGLALRRPGIASYEPFATLFDFRGTGIQWALLLLVTFASLLIYRPFCNYLCPLDPVYDFIAASRNWVREVYRKWHNRKAIQI